VERDVPRPFVVYAVHEAADEAGAAAGRALAASRAWLRVLYNHDVPGTAGAVRTGFREISAGPVIVTLADAGDDLSVVPRMLALYAQGYRIVCPSRFARAGRQIGGSRLKRLLLRATGLSLRALVGFPTLDLNNNYRLYEASLVNALGIESRNGFELALELTAKAFRRGVRIAEIPTTWHDRRPGGAAGATASWLGSYLRWCAYALRSGRRPRRMGDEETRGPTP
jgi:hypothetical protein